MTEHIGDVTMNESGFLAERFEANRPHLRAVAYRMLGSVSEADDAMQEAWLRLRRADTSEVENLGGWLTTVVARVCLDMLRSRASRREDQWDGSTTETAVGPDEGTDPEHQAVLADSIGVALLVVLDRLSPAERVAFVLHDLFAVPFDEIAPIVGRSPDATRQLASRARRRVRGAEAGPEVDRTRRRAIVAAFLAAARGGDLGGLIALLDPDVVLRADRAAVDQGAEEEVLGAAAVAGTFVGRARGARPALVDGVPGLVWSVGGRPRMVFGFRFATDRIVAIELLADPERLGELDLALLDD